MTKLFRSEENKRVKLTKREKENILKINRDFRKISKSVYFDNYDLPCPILVESLSKIIK